MDYRKLIPNLRRKEKKTKKKSKYSSHLDAILKKSHRDHRQTRDLYPERSILAGVPIKKPVDHCVHKSKIFANRYIRGADELVPHHQHHHRQIQQTYHQCQCHRCNHHHCQCPPPPPNRCGCHGCNPAMVVNQCQYHHHQNQQAVTKTADVNMKHQPSPLLDSSSPEPPDPEMVARRMILTKTEVATGTISAGVLATSVDPFTLPFKKRMGKMGYVIKKIDADNLFIRKGKVYEVKQVNRQLNIGEGKGRKDKGGVGEFNSPMLASGTKNIDPFDGVTGHIDPQSLVEQRRDRSPPFELDMGWNLLGRHDDKDEINKVKDNEFQFSPVDEKKKRRHHGFTVEISRTKLTYFEDDYEQNDGGLDLLANVAGAAPRVEAKSLHPERKRTFGSHHLSFPYVKEEESEDSDEEDMKMGDWMKPVCLAQELFKKLVIDANTEPMKSKLQKESSLTIVCREMRELAIKAGNPLTMEELRKEQEWYAMNGWE